ncbi:hypothetical protein MMRN_38790 [Mycobacterium marinum]|nr:hypothetical protein MMRN_38790 [Mycobacterium marinum]
MATYSTASATSLTRRVIMSIAPSGVTTVNISSNPTVAGAVLVADVDPVQLAAPMIRAAIAMEMGVITLRTVPKDVVAAP